MTAVCGRDEGPRTEDRKDMKDRLLDAYVKTCNIWKKPLSKPPPSLYPPSQGVWACKMVWLKLGGNSRGWVTLQTCLCWVQDEPIKDIESYPANYIKRAQRDKGVFLESVKSEQNGMRKKCLQIMHILLWHSMLPDDGHQSCPVQVVRVTISLSGLWTYEALMTGLHG